MAKKRQTIYQQVTAEIIAAMDRDQVAPWVQPWRGAGAPFPHNGSTGRAYSGINIVLCSMAARAQGFSHNEWWTAKQISAKGATIKRGAKPVMVLFAKPMVVDDEGEVVPDKEPLPDDELEEGLHRAVMTLGHLVYNRSQCEGLPAPRFDGPPLQDVPTIARAESLIQGNKHLPPIGHVRGGSAYYAPGPDRISMPAKGQFRDSEAYYSVLFHECTHSTGHKSRLARKGIVDLKKFGDENYSKEELVAEMGASFLCALAGIANERTRMMSVAYLKNWRDRLAKDPQLVVLAAGAASVAADYIVDGAPKWKKAMPHRAPSKPSPTQAPARKPATTRKPKTTAKPRATTKPSARPKANPGTAGLIGLGYLVALGVIRPDGTRVELTTSARRWLAWDESTSDLRVVAVQPGGTSDLTPGQRAGHERFHGHAPRGGLTVELPAAGDCPVPLGLLEYVTYETGTVPSTKRGAPFRHFFGDTGEHGHGPEVLPHPRYPQACMPELRSNRAGTLLEIRRRPGNVYTVRDWIFA